MKLTGFSRAIHRICFGRMNFCTDDMVPFWYVTWALADSVFFGTVITTSSPLSNIFSVGLNLGRVMDFGGSEQGGQRPAIHQPRATPWESGEKETQP
jgi:hypothetical protein